MRYLAVTATMTNDSTFYSGKRVRGKADHYARLRKRLQKKGTRSATRRKIAMSGRERRLKLQVNHTIAKSIVNAHPHTLIGLEDLTGIRERTTRRTRRRKKHGKGLLFICRNEQCPYRQRTGRPYTLHADLVGARNIAMRTFFTRQDWVKTGVLSVRPDVSDDETKAARLARYAELRWSSDTR